MSRKFNDFVVRPILKVIVRYNVKLYRLLKIMCFLVDTVCVKKNIKIFDWFCKS